METSVFGNFIWTTFKIAIHNYKRGFQPFEHITKFLEMHVFLVALGQSIAFTQLQDWKPSYRYSVETMYKRLDEDQQVILNRLTVKCSYDTCGKSIGADAAVGFNFARCIILKNTTGQKWNVFTDKFESDDPGKGNRIGDGTCIPCSDEATGPHITPCADDESEHYFSDLEAKWCHANQGDLPPRIKNSAMSPQNQGSSIVD